ncbi:uncharacterized protein BDZ99DRAFT_107062 [Mytilinidion resinicola]|uniref:PWI domain-containing protein n=1 Tax=Mytilinidion resinicola TaxID=574789 RepID=A0A6A6YA11_9PEZI|nr:uncharacterized protein BDZ99DRAFT_107062 [Mytilinidion resinicola]KAF2805540.1 hypothetical protein BDZ99DRAFT_107062 [Mytilinidion resinicola]
MAPPPGMGAPPGMPAPGTAAPPGMAQAQGSLPGRPAGLPLNFQPPANMPNINFNAPVIRLGTSGPTRQDSSGGRRESAADPGSAGGRRGLGHEYRGADRGFQMREPVASLNPPTREEIARTIFVNNITEALGNKSGGGDDFDHDLQRILRCAGGLRRWTRATDANGQPCKFGFAEYEDSQGLATAAKIFKDIQVPVKKQEPKAKKDVEKDGVDGEDEKKTVEKATLQIVVDEASVKYADEWQERKKESEEEVEFRTDTAKNNLADVLASLFNPPPPNNIDVDVAMYGDIVMQGGDVKPEGTNAEVVTIPLTVEDELSDIPEDMRETVAAEIAAFRDRSHRRDMERLRQEEELEAAQWARNVAGSRANRLGSPPRTAPLGPAGGANGIPVGPRDRGVHGAPSGPKGFGAQIPKDYQGGVSFVNGANGSAGWIKRDDEDDSASDSEIERRHKAKKESDLEKQYLDYERRWINREKSRGLALEREKARDTQEEADKEKVAAEMAKKLKDWNDEVEATTKNHEYHRDHAAWARKRADVRLREFQADNMDREQEKRDNAHKDRLRKKERDMADNFLDQLYPDVPAQEPAAPFKLSLGAAAQKVNAAAAPRKSAAEIESLLEDEEEEEVTTRRILVPIQIDTAAEAASLTPEERKEATRQLALSIPVADKEALFSWEVKWDFFDDAALEGTIMPFVEKKIMDYLGVQEQEMIDFIGNHLKNRGKPEDLVSEFEALLDDDAEQFVMKLWRMLIFCSESAAKGLS